MSTDTATSAGGSQAAEPGPVDDVLRASHAPTPSTPNETPGGVTGAPGSGVRRLNPADGLFLRAQHLGAMQQFSYELALVAGRTTGAGVAQGFRVTLDQAGKRLGVQSGVALAPDGSPLVLTDSLTLDVSGLRAAARPNGYWVVEIAPRTWPFGNENAYGAICGEPCQGAESSIQPWMQLEVEVRVRPETLIGLDDRADARRNRLASGLFARDLGDRRWLSSTPPGLTRHDCAEWRTGWDAADGNTLPLAVLLVEDGVLVLDAWMLRRDLGAPHDETTWMRVLGRRPAPEFWAQVLQFQEHYCTVQGVVAQAPSVPDARAEQISALEKAASTMAGLPPELQTRIDALAAVPPPQADDAAMPSLVGLGFDQLPPGGFLPGVGSGAAARSRVDALFADTVNLRYCRARPDHVPGAIEAAQHLDRIPLDADSPKPDVTILVPELPMDLEQALHGPLDWVAFVRRAEPSCGEVTTTPTATTDRLAVYYRLLGRKEINQVLRTGQVPEPQEHDDVDFDHDDATPRSEVPQLDLDLNRQVKLCYVAHSDARAEVLAKRAVVVAQANGSQEEPVRVPEPGTARECVVFLQQARTTPPPDDPNA